MTRIRAFSTCLKPTDFSRWLFSFYPTCVGFIYITNPNIYIGTPYVVANLRIYD